MSGVEGAVQWDMDDYWVNVVDLELPDIAACRGDYSWVTIDSIDFCFTEFDADSSRCKFTLLGRLDWADYPNRQGKHKTYYNKSEGVALQVVQMFVSTCTTLRDLSFSFDHLKPGVRDRLLRAVFPIVCTSPRLFGLGFTFLGDSVFDIGSWILAADSGVRRFLETGLPVLLRDSPYFGSLRVVTAVTTNPCQSMAYGFSRGQSSKEWKLKRSRHMHPGFDAVQEMFALLVGALMLQEVELECSAGEPSCGQCLEDTAGLVARNFTTLERLNAGAHCQFSSKDSSQVAEVARALRCNRSLKEFQYRCTLAELHELARVFVPDRDRGESCNSSLSKLKVEVAGNPSIFDCMVALAPLHGATVAALEQGIVCEPEHGPCGQSRFTLKLTSCEDSQPHPDVVGCVTLSRLVVHLRDYLDHLTDIEDILRMSSALAEVEILLQVGLVLQRTGPSSAVSALTLHLPPVDDRRPRTVELIVVPERPWAGTVVKRSPSESVEAAHKVAGEFERGVQAARTWMTAVKAFLGLVERVEAVLCPGGVGLSGQLAMRVQGEVRKGLELLVKEELRGNTCLQSLQVGWWRLVRVGAGDDELEMRYVGPCLGRRDEYHVKVELQLKHNCFVLPS